MADWRDHKQTDEEKRQDLYDEAVGQQRAIDRTKKRRDFKRKYQRRVGRR